MDMLLIVNQNAGLSLLIGAAGLVVWQRRRHRIPRRGARKSTATWKEGLTAADCDGLDGRCCAAADALETAGGLRPSGQLDQGPLPEQEQQQQLFMHHPGEVKMTT
jgi:hypothetical protein